MKQRYFWFFNRNLWTPKGVYVVSDSEAVGLSKPLKTEELEKRLNESPAGSPICYSSDGTIRFAPKKSYELGEHTPESFAKDGFVIASFGVESAERLGEVVMKLKYNPRTWGLEIEEGVSPVQRLSAVSGFYCRLYLGGCGSDARDGYASGVMD